MKTFRNRQFFALDLLFLALAPFLVYALRFEGFHWADADRLTAIRFALFAVPCQLATFGAFRLYQRMWRFASIGELEAIFVAGAAAGIVCMLLGGSILPGLGVTPVRVPLSVLFTHSMLTIAIIAGPRLYFRVGGWRSTQRLRDRSSDRRVLVAGAGAAGQMIVKEMLTNSDLQMFPVGFVDDDSSKHGLNLASLPVFGPLSQLSRVIAREHIQELIIAMPRAPGRTVRDVVRTAVDAGVKTRIVPGLSEILSDRVSVSALRDVQIEDLLRRDAVQTNLREVARLANGKTVLVTGAGGSIGSELCRQLAALGPRTLILLGHGENSIFDMAQELRQSHSAVTVVSVIADIRDAQRLRQVFTAHRPDVVFHAAAHKHVPLMEENVIEAITNNVLGTRNVVDAARAVNVSRLVAISTDKAVRPTNIMGATKRVAELVVQTAALRDNVNFVSVRFGNVLGSRGSVVPTFLRQIRAGGPLTVTDPEMRRYFMTIPEAVQLVLQAGALGSGGELFMLDMGEPVRILDLAKDLIRLSGLEEGIDIAIEFTGVRPGEKLYEEMFLQNEEVTVTDHPKVLRALNGHGPKQTPDLVDAIIRAAQTGRPDSEMRALLATLVPELAGGNSNGHAPARASGANGAPSHRQIDLATT